MRYPARLLCFAGRHDWEPHPGFTSDLFRDNVRQCRRCPRVESRAFRGVWTRKRHLELDRA